MGFWEVSSLQYPQQDSLRVELHDLHTVTVSSGAKSTSFVIPGIGANIALYIHHIYSVNSDIDESINVPTLNIVRAQLFKLSDDATPSVISCTHSDRSQPSELRLIRALDLVRSPDLLVPGGPYAIIGADDLVIIPYVSDAQCLFCLRTLIIGQIWNVLPCPGNEDALRSIAIGFASMQMDPGIYQLTYVRPAFNNISVLQVSSFLHCPHCCGANTCEA